MKTPPSFADQTQTTLANKLAGIKSRFKRGKVGRPKKRGRPRKPKSKAGKISYAESQAKEFEKFSAKVAAGHLNSYSKQQVSEGFVMSVDMLKRRFKAIKNEIILEEQQARTQATQTACMQRLWLAVLAEQLRDITPNTSPSQRAALTNWLHSPDFAQICELANVDTGRARQAFKAAIKGKIDVSGKFKITLLS